VLSVTSTNCELC